MAFLNDATDFIHFKCKILLEEAGGDPIKKAELIRDIVTTVAKIPDPIKRTVFTQETSRLMDISEQTLLNELNKIRAKDLSNANKKVRGPEALSEPGPNDLPPEYAHLADAPVEHNVEENQNNKAFQEQESELMRILLQYGTKEIKVDGADEEEVTISVAEFIVLSMDEDTLSFENPIYQGIFNEYKAQIESGNIPNEKHFLNSHDQELNAAIINLMDFKYELFDWEKHNIFVKTEEDLLMKAVDTAVHRVKLANVQKNIDTLSLKSKEECNDDDILLLMRYHEIKKALTKVLGRS
jgi:DNA primase